MFLNELERLIKYKKGGINMAWENILKMGKKKRWFKDVDELMSDKKLRTSKLKLRGYYELDICS